MKLHQIIRDRSIPFLALSNSTAAMVCVTEIDWHAVTLRLSRAAGDGGQGFTHHRYSSLFKADDETFQYSHLFGAKVTHQRECLYQSSDS